MLKSSNTQQLWFVAAALTGTVLAGCDEGSATRQALAQCKVSIEDKPKVFGHYPFGPLLLCMQAKGFVEDNSLIKASGERCGPDIYSHEDAECYRRDTDLAKWLAEVRAKPAD